MCLITIETQATYRPTAAFCPQTESATITHLLLPHRLPVCPHCCRSPTTLAWHTLTPRCTCLTPTSIWHPLLHFTHHSSRSSLSAYRRSTP